MYGAGHVFQDKLADRLAFVDLVSQDASNDLPHGFI